MNHRVVRSLKPSFAAPLPEELTKNLSCAEMAVLKVQSDRVNVRVAAEVADYLYRMATGNLKRFVTYFGLESRMARSLYITQQSVCALVKAIA
jgi:molybdopterin/thiamine biosynthesis adenylyltransferase